MKHLFCAFAVIAAWLCNQAAHAAPAECFASSGAVFAAHPNATHASYTARGRRSAGSGRCWYADAFKAEAKKAEAKTAEAKADLTLASRIVAAVAQEPAPRVAIPAPESHPHTTAVAPTPRPRSRAVTTVTVPFPKGIPPAIQAAVSAQELSRFSAVDEAPADFESRFSGIRGVETTTVR